MLGKPLQEGTTSADGVPLIKKGATRPPKDYQSSMTSLLLSGVTDTSSKKKVGIGNAAMGGVFKSIYLAQGRNSQASALKSKFIVESYDLSLCRQPETLADTQRFV